MWNINLIAVQFTALLFAALFSRHSVLCTTNLSHFLMIVIKLWIVVNFVGCEVMLALCCQSHHLAGQTSGFLLNVSMCQWHTQDFWGEGRGGGGSTNSVEDRGQRGDLGAVGSTQFANE
jgi:hypothetical protein